ncbi:UDP-N-acetylmuramoyl-L-alanyl-D-glutamate--2,6-diaminopimelate ligase [Miniphocaeibacter massiliensis]|uniref:UDP-N-acetylmuramoyl-L-alanyl-D-glutamate--2, 6-diaminopimelate ligase n=1 Tax=Miniphocaeibacter massiliensis TaxID=2041841 RepID=UPI000C1BC014|nr:UDP-N-acetylmuramoyl-L-alanyl-D-glutamate--2,6-diaminopimelate ligase [Miniphocaeibacter massiliensis]
MLISELLTKVETLAIKGDTNIEIDYISINSKDVNEKTAFMAIKGFVTDGHKYIDNAIENGTRVVFHQNDLENYNKNIVYVKLKDTRSGLSDVSEALFGYPSKELNIIGVTGTNGKTTATYMVESILNNCGESTASIGSIGLKTKNGNTALGKTTPEANILQKIFRELLNDGVKNCVMEASSHSLELNRVKGVDFDYGIFTNLTIEHLDLHGDMENYYQAKKKLFCMTSKANLINIDDEYGKRLAKELKEEGKEVLTYGIENQADYMAIDIDMDVSSSKFTFKTPRGNIEINMPISALFNVYNALGAMGVISEMGISLEEISKGIADFEGPEGRYEIVKNNKGLNLVIDFAHTPDAIEKLLKFVKSSFDKKVVIVFGINGARTTETRYLAGEVAGKYADLSIVTEDDVYYHSVYDISKPIIDGIKNSNGKFLYFEKRQDAVEKAVKMATKDDIVLFLGKGNERYLKKGGVEHYYYEIEEIKKVLGEI